MKDSGRSKLGLKPKQAASAKPAQQTDSRTAEQPESESFAKRLLTAINSVR